jgi:PAS domain S-box-containing protein
MSTPARATHDGEIPGPPAGWWETVLSFTSDAVLTLTLDGMVTSWNPGAERLYGYPAEEIVGSHFEQLVPSERQAEMREAIERVASGRPVASFDTVRMRKDGETVDVSVSITPLLGPEGKVDGAAVIGRDVSDHKRVEKQLADEVRARESFEGRLVDLNRQLRQRLQDLETLLEVLPVGIGIAHDRECSEIRLNPAFAEMLRLPADMPPTIAGFAGEGHGFEVVRDDEPVPIEEFPLQQSCATGEPVSDVELDVLFDDGSRRHLLCFAAPLLDDMEEPRGAVGAFIDITEKRRAETELLQANAIKDEFLGLVSHELRTPLTVVLGLARYLSRDALSMDESTLQDTIGQLRTDAERLANVIENMLVLSRLDFEDTELEPVRVAATVESAVFRQRARFPRREVRLEVEGSGLIEGNATWLEQVVTNLLTNAEKYSPQGEPILVRVEETERHVDIVVADRGEGVDTEEVSHLFEPFYRSRRAQGTGTPGLGLGLTVCKRLAELQGGIVRAEGREGGGSVFRVTFPAVSGDGEA